MNVPSVESPLKKKCILILVGKVSNESSNLVDDEPVRHGLGTAYAVAHAATALDSPNNTILIGRMVTTAK